MHFHSSHRHQLCTSLSVYNLHLLSAISVITSQIIKQSINYICHAQCTHKYVHIHHVWTDTSYPHNHRNTWTKNWLPNVKYAETKHYMNALKNLMHETIAALVKFTEFSNNQLFTATTLPMEVNSKPTYTIHHTTCAVYRPLILHWYHSLLCFT